MGKERVKLKSGIEVEVDFSEGSSKCRGCEAEIYWGVTSTGKRMPVTIISHFVDCPKAMEFRKEGRREGN